MKFNRNAMEGGSDDDEDENTSVCCLEIQVMGLILVVKTIKAFQSLYFNPILILIHESIL